MLVTLLSLFKFYPFQKLSTWNIKVTTKQVICYPEGVMNLPCAFVVCKNHYYSMVQLYFISKILNVVTHKSCEKIVITNSPVTACNENDNMFTTLLMLLVDCIVPAMIMLYAMCEHVLKELLSMAL